MTIQAALAHGRKSLAHIFDAPDIDAERLLLHVLKEPEPSWLFAHNDETISPAQQELFEQLVAERSSGKPLAYILGTSQFYGRTFFVNNNVLIPRPETEAIIDASIEYCRKHTVTTIADIATGSGCIAITLALELPDVRIVATDISPAALEVAKKNAEIHGVDDRIEFVEGSMLEPLSGRAIDLIVSNPPYVPTAEVDAAGTKPDTLGLTFEPRIALDGGVDGKTFVKKIASSGIPAIVEGVGGTVKLFN